MGRKIFVSYKYSDSQVMNLNTYTQNLWGGPFKVQTTARHYVDKLTEILENDDHIFKGENDGESLAAFSDQHIISKLRSKIFDSTITIVFISKGMRNIWEDETEQWMPWGISYSLKEITRNGRTSGSNAVIAVVLPDQFGNYDYYISHDPICNCTSLNVGFLFNILRYNMFNEKNPTVFKCTNGSIVYSGDYCYIQSVKWSDFILSHNYYLDKAVEIKNKRDKYNITKNL
ncbi:TIR domain-containing protein [Fibrella forsythiae]|uniref:TIR domain-containing protein n=1 Tax=Fibrella forsythiae TaxID=2817061 RepID=A0ABS3JSB4_9BACT|nr:TIR domain-containing protein [Fibrella forsythiae]MBO0952899.1 TIR domain-containing protein [Fibrella forsythiae]